MIHIPVRNSCRTRERQQVAWQAHKRSCGTTQFSHFCSQRRHVQLYLISKAVASMSICSRSNKRKYGHDRWFSQAAVTQELGRNSIAAHESGHGKTHGHHSRAAAHTLWYWTDHIRSSIHVPLNLYDSVTAYLSPGKSPGRAGKPHF